VGDFYFGVRCGSRVWFLSVCACVLWVEIGFVFLPLFGVVFGVCVGFCGEIIKVEIVPFLSQKG